MLNQNSPRTILLNIFINQDKILGMKKWLLIFCIFVALSHTAFAGSDYVAMMQKCDTEYENASKKNFSTIEIVQTIDTHTDAIKQLYQK